MPHLARELKQVAALLQVEHGKRAAERMSRDTLTVHFTQLLSAFDHTPHPAYSQRPPPTEKQRFFAFILRPPVLMDILPQQLAHLGEHADFTLFPPLAVHLDIGVMHILHPQTC